MATQVNKHVFPLFLDAAPETVTVTGDLPVTTSFIKLQPTSGDVDYAVPDGTIPGQILVCFNNTINDSNITITTPLDADAKTITLDGVGNTCTLMWNGSAWAVLNGIGATSLT